MVAESENATRQALRQIELDGSDLGKPLLMDFFVAVPSELAGLEVARAVAVMGGFDTSVEVDDESGDWTCYCTIKMIPELSAVLQIEERLDEIGKSVGGKADGFGTFGNTC